MDVRVLRKLVVLDHPLEHLGVDEPVILAVRFAEPYRPGGVGHAELELACELGEEEPGQGGFAGAAGRRHDHERTTIGHRGRHHSTFWTCSRTFSSTALASTT